MQHTIRRGSFQSVTDLATEIDHFVQTYNKTARPFCVDRKSQLNFGKDRTDFAKVFPGRNTRVDCIRSLTVEARCFRSPGVGLVDSYKQAKCDAALNPFGFIVSFSIHAVRGLSSRNIF